MSTYSEHEDVGLLTWSQWVKAQDALSRTVDLCVELRAIGGAKIRQEGGGRSAEPALPLHPGWVLAQDIEAMNSELHFWDSDEEAANTEDGAGLLRRITSAVQSANRLPRRHHLHLSTVRCSARPGTRAGRPAGEGDSDHRSEAGAGSGQSTGETRQRG